MRDYHINIFYSEEDGGYIADIPELEACRPSARRRMRRWRSWHGARDVDESRQGRAQAHPAAPLPARHPPTASGGLESVAMRRVFRHLFTICSALSLLLCVSTTLLWIQSYWVGELYYFEPVEAPAADATPLPGQPPRVSPWCYQDGVAYGAGRIVVFREHLPADYADPGGSW
jgi:hypothetical protein